VGGGEVIRWLLAVPLGLLGAWAVLCNYACVALALLRGQHHSVVPLLGGGLLAVAWLLCPATEAAWGWVPLALDPGCWVCLLAGAYFLVGVSWRRGRAEPVAAADRPRD
jgi:hypothetical protein